MFLLDDTLLFLKKYWFIGVIAFLFTILFVSQKRAGEIIALQTQTHQKEKKLLQEQHQKEIKEIQERLKQFDEDKKKLQEEQERLLGELKKKKTQIIKKYIVLWQDDLPQLKKELEELFDIKEYKP